MKIGVIGAGECFREKMLPPLNETGNVKTEWIVDILPEENVRKSVIEAGVKNDFDYYQIEKEDGFLQSLPDGNVDVVIESSPSRYHANNTSLALDSGKNVYIEKPFSISQENIDQIENALNSNSKNLAYFAEYYRDEKGLALRVLNGEIKKGDWYEKFIHPGISPDMNKVIESIGKIKKIHGTCLEGEGKKSSISHRWWVGDKDQGGQLLDMATHLVSFLYTMDDQLGDISLKECVAGVCKQANNEYKSKFGRDIAETYAEMKLESSNGCKIDFKFGKYTGVANRVFEIEGENGKIKTDFETQNTVVKTLDYQGEIGVRSPHKYSIIMGDLQRRLGSSGQYGFENSKKTLQTILKAKENVDHTFLYNSGDLTPIQKM